ncbi:MAG: ABC transporter ATP-binding protein [Rhodospirillales bacterium]
MADLILKVSGLTKSFGAVRASDGLSFNVERGSIHALIGPNGAGKSTAIAQISGETSQDSGRIEFDGHDISRMQSYCRARLGLQRSYQITSLFPNLTAEDNVALAVQAGAGHSFRFWSAARRDPALREPARAALRRVGLADREGLPVTQLAHGEQRQLELAMAMATKPSMLLLDEPMAGMGHQEGVAMMEAIRSLKGDVSILLVEHDMDIVFSLADKISVLVKGSVLMTGSADEVRNDRDVRAAYLGEEN